jgi:hypothetical protein
MSNMKWRYFGLILLNCLLAGLGARAQKDASATAVIDAMQISVGDRAKVFITVSHNSKTSKIVWPVLPDSVNQLEVVEKAKIDTTVHGNEVVYKQRLLVTGFDSGVFVFPQLDVKVIPNGDSAYTLHTDSFRLLVQTLPVDTSKAFKPIKGIISISTTWRDYLGYIIGGIVLLIVIIIVTVMLTKKLAKKTVVPVKKGPTESIQDITLRKLEELDKKNLWQQDKIKPYYTELTDIVRQYIEERFNTPAMELTTDELLYKAKVHRNLQPYRALLEQLLRTADLAKFAKAQPLPEEHIAAIESAREFIGKSKPAVQSENPGKQS